MILQKIVVFVLVFCVTSLSSAQDTTFTVVASHSILADVVKNIAGDNVNVIELIPSGQDPHTFTPLASDMVTLSTADVVFVNGAMFEEGLLDSIETASGAMDVITVSECVPFITTDLEQHDETHDDDDHGEDEENHHADEECEDYVETISSLLSDEMMIMPESAVSIEHCNESDHLDEGDDHAHGACDPHVWFDPVNVMFWTQTIRDTLTELDPKNADVYRQNSETYLQELSDFITETAFPLVETIPVENRVLVTNHDSMRYFAQRFGFELADTVIPGSSTLAEPAPVDIARLIETIRNESILAIFTDSTVNSSVAEQISRETGVMLHMLYTGGLSASDGPASTYLDYMTYNVNTVVNALTSTQE